MAIQTKKEIFLYGILDENPIFKMVLGICSSLAVTGSVSNTLTMGIAVIFVTCFSSLIVSQMRNTIPHKARMATYVVIISTFVMITDNLLQAYFPEISRAMGPYVGLIVTNCIIMGRCEAFAGKNPPLNAFIDALGVSIGYSLMLLLIACIREISGWGTLLGYPVLPSAFPKFAIMTMAPGAFFTLAVLIWIIRSILPEKVEKLKTKEPEKLHCKLCVGEQS